MYVWDMAARRVGPRSLTINPYLTRAHGGLGISCASKIPCLPAHVSLGGSETGHPERSGGSQSNGQLLDETICRARAGHDGGSSIALTPYVKVSDHSTGRSQVEARTSPAPFRVPPIPPRCLWKVPDCQKETSLRLLGFFGDFGALRPSQRIRVSQGNKRARPVLLPGACPSSHR